MSNTDFQKQAETKQKIVFFYPTQQFFVPVLVEIWETNQTCSVQLSKFRLCHIRYEHIKTFVDLYFYVCLFVCLFICLFGFFIPLENFLLIWRSHHWRWRAVKFDLCSTFKAIERWGLFSMPYLLWYGTSVYNGHLRGPVTITHFVKGLPVKLSLPVLMT